MGCKVREKQKHPKRWVPPPKPDSVPIDKDLGQKSSDSQLSVEESAKNPNSNPSSNDCWGCCTEDQLEEVLLTKLDFVLDEVISRLVELGYESKVAFQAVLRFGNCYGVHDVMNNLLETSLAYLKGKLNEVDEGYKKRKGHVCVEMKELRDSMLDGMVSFLRDVHPDATKGDALWCLLMSELHLGRASWMIQTHGPCPMSSGDSVGSTRWCRFHGSRGCENQDFFDVAVNDFLDHATAEMGLQREIECPPHFTPPMEKLLKRNVALFAAAYRVKAKRAQAAAWDRAGDSSSVVETRGEALTPREETWRAEGEARMKMIIEKLAELTVYDVLKLRSPKDEKRYSMRLQISDLEKQLRERMEWANDKALQAARKLTNDITELKRLRMERAENLRLKQVKPSVDESTLKKLFEIEGALRAAGSQADRVNAAVRRLEMENAEVRAEIQASKLSASESVAVYLEVTKREKRYVKRLLGWDKQRAKLLEGIAAEKQRIKELQEEIVQVEAAKNAAEEKSRCDRKARDLTLAQLQEDERLKVAFETNAKRHRKVLRSKIEIDFQRHKDDFERLNQELARLRADEHRTHDPYGQTQTLARLLHELDDSDGNSSEADRECVICSKDNASVVFLPCAHQVLCSRCNQEYANASCPVCWADIEQRVRVFGASP